MRLADIFTAGLNISITSTAVPVHMLTGSRSVNQVKKKRKAVMTHPLICKDMAL